MATPKSDWTGTPQSQVPETPIETIDPNVFPHLRRRSPNPSSIEMNIATTSAHNLPARRLSPRLPIYNEAELPATGRRSGRLSDAVKGGHSATSNTASRQSGQSNGLVQLVHAAEQQSSGKGRRPCSGGQPNVAASRLGYEDFDGSNSLEQEGGRDSIRSFNRDVENCVQSPGHLVPYSTQQALANDSDSRTQMIVQSFVSTLQKDLKNTRLAAVRLLDSLAELARKHSDELPENRAGGQSGEIEPDQEFVDRILRGIALLGNVARSVSLQQSDEENIRLSRAVKECPICQRKFPRLCDFKLVDDLPTLCTRQPSWI